MIGMPASTDHTRARFVVSSVLLALLLLAAGLAHPISAHAQAAPFEDLRLK